MGAVVPVLLLSGCSSGGGSAQSGSGASGAASAAAGQDRGVKFAQCMRGEGIDMPDPKDGSGAQGLAGVLDKAMQGPDKQKVQDAVGACRRYLPAGSVDGGGKAQQKQLELARCLRRQGVDVPDPKPGQGLVMPKGGDTQKVDDALRQCVQAGGGR
ncbi:MAG: hypothetical protein HOY69_15255 [Streptomyces sp.]|nr:hypothetical protein [Streptomyces sp.]